MLKQLALCLLLSSSAQAKVTTDQAAQLGEPLTPTGATRVADEAGIPVWQDVTTIDPDEKPLFTITHANYREHQAHLSAGQIALFEAYPDTFKMPVYPSHRTFAAPDWFYANTQANALTATLNENQTGFVGAKAGIPFPIPQSALEVYFNHIARWRGRQVVSRESDVVVNKKGKISTTSRDTLVRFDYYLEDNQAPNRLFSVISKTTAPASKSGGGGLVLEPIDQVAETRSAWLWDKGRRRVIRAPNVSYDQPIQSAAGLRTADDTDMINGSPDRFDWSLLAPRLLYIPYNNNRLDDPALGPKDLLQTGHLNPEHTRYELHRVWVIRATLKANWRHLYSQRDFYLDEDSWSVVVADQYDKQGQLYRVSLSYLKQEPELPGTIPAMNVFHDLNSRQYHVMGLKTQPNQGPKFHEPLAKDNVFTPNGLKRYVK